MEVMCYNYGGAIDQCDFSDSYIKGLTALNSISTIISANTSNNSSDITSDPRKICFCANKVQNCLRDSDNIIVLVKRGQLFTLSVVSVGQANSPISSTIRSYIEDSDGNTQLNQLNHTVQNQCRDIDFKLLSPQTNHTLILYPEGPCSSSATKSIQVIFEPCPAGFALDVNQCICEQRLRDIDNANISCDIESGLIKRPRGTWIKPMWDNMTEEYTGFILSTICPIGYCNDSIGYLNFSFAARESACDAQCQEQTWNVMWRMQRQSQCDTKHISLQEL